MRRLLIGPMVVAVLMAIAGPALAKGPQGATISGPGIERPIVIDGDGEYGNGTAFSAFVEATGFWQLVFAADFAGGANGLLADAPTDDLGVAYTITWHLADARVEAIVYPLAAGGSLTYMAPDVWVPGLNVETEGGWFRAPQALAPMLEGYGVVMLAPPVTTSTVTTPPSPPKAAAAATPVAVTELTPAAAPPGDTSGSVLVETSGSAVLVETSGSAVPAVLVVGLVLVVVGVVIWAIGRRPRRVSAP